MFQFRPQETSLESISVSEIRRRIGMGLMLILGFGGIVYNIITITANVSLTANTDPQYTAMIIGVVSLGLYFILRRNILIDFVLHVPLVMLLYVSLVSSSELAFTIVAFAAMIYAALMTRFPIFIGTVVIIFITSAIQQQQLPEFPYLLYAMVTTLLGSLIFYTIYNFSIITESAARTNRLLRISSDIAQVINRELELQQLLDNTVNTIRDEFDFYHVQVFLIDEAYQYANLVASTGKAGEQLLARNHRLPVGSQSVIGRVAQVGEPVVAGDTGADTVHALNELLPNTRSELALPIIDSNKVIGALDVQSVRSGAFQPIDIQALQIITNQLAAAIRNARLFEQAQQNIQDNKQLLFEYETNLRQVDRLNRTLTKQSWDKYLAQAYIDGVTLTEQRILPEAEWSDAMRAAAQNQQTHVENNEDRQVITVPIVLRDQVLGAIEVEINNKSPHASDSIEMIQAISQRLAISLESARLFEETQEATLQEQQINEIVSSYETAVTIDELLQVTLERLQQALGAEQGTVRLGTVNTNGSSSHSYNGNGGKPS